MADSKTTQHRVASDPIRQPPLPPAAVPPMAIPHATPLIAMDNMSSAAVNAQRQLLAQIVRSYRSPVVRMYSRIRFLILRQDFLNEVGQYLPASGRILDIGCGFGLFALYFAGGSRGLHIEACDLNAKRIAMARLAARSCNITNVRFEARDAVGLSPSGHYDAAYCLDLIHHLPCEAVPDFLRKVRDCLRPGGVLIIKDVDTRPHYKRWFTLALDRVMVGLSEPIRYWSSEELRRLLTDLGFSTITHKLRDVLPYPHVLHVCRR